MKLEGRTILITGGSGGIGFELASQLIERGNTVIVTGRDPSALAAAKTRLPKLQTIQSDVTDPQAIKALHDRVLLEFPRLDVLINNAGVMRKINLQSFDGGLLDISREIDINLTGLVRMVMQFLPHLMAQPRALIVNVSSGLAFSPYPIAPIYGATKAAVHSFTQSLRVQLKRTNIHVVELAPPAVDTPLSHAFAGDMAGTPLMNVTKLATEALRHIEKDRLEIRVGFANVLKLMSRIAPAFILGQLSKPVDQMHAQMKELGPRSIVISPPVSPGA